MVDCSDEAPDNRPLNLHFDFTEFYSELIAVVCLANSQLYIICQCTSGATSRCFQQKCSFKHALVVLWLFHCKFEIANSIPSEFIICMQFTFKWKPRLKNEASIEGPTVSRSELIHIISNQIITAIIQSSNVARACLTG